MAKVMGMWIDADGDLFFDDYFDEEDSEKIKKFLEEELEYKVVFQRDDERVFKPIPAIWKKKVVRDIDWSNYNNILYIIEYREKTDEDIVKALHSKGSGFSITIKRGIVMTEYSKLLELEGNKPSKEKLIAWSKEIVNRFMKGKRIPVGSKVLANFRDTKLKGKIVGYEKGDYEIELEDGAKCIYKRNEFELD